MKEFHSLNDFVKHLERVVKKYPAQEYKTLQYVGQFLEKKAKESIGWLQESAGPFNKWEPLAESTMRDKERQGFVFNSDYNPLYRTGELKESIHHVVNRPMRTLYVGSTSDIMVYQELGTSRIPPRSVLGMTMFKHKREIEYFLGSFLMYWIADVNLRFRVAA